MMSVKACLQEIIRAQHEDCHITMYDDMVMWLCYSPHSDCHTTELFNFYCIPTSAAVFSHVLHLHHQLLVPQSGAMHFKAVHTYALLAESAL